MRVKKYINNLILKTAECVLPYTTFDRLLIERRKRINKITTNYPYATFISKKKSSKKYCIVRYTIPTFGLMAAGIQYIFCYHQLVKRGYIPIIDIEYAHSFRQGRIGENNVWDACFIQPITAKEAILQPYVLLAGDLFSYSNDPSICLELNNDISDHFIHVKKDKFKEYYAKANKYAEPIWKVKEEILSELDEEIWNQMSGKRVLGIFLRESFSKDKVYNDKSDWEVFRNHPLLPGVKETIEIIKTQLASWKYDMIFLSTAYTDSVIQFKEEFGDKIVYLDRERKNIKDTSGTNFGMDERELYEITMSKMPYYTGIATSYIKEIVALSRCNYLLGGASSGMVAALVMNGGEYDDICVLEDARKIKRY